MDYNNNKDDVSPWRKGQLHFFPFCTLVEQGECMNAYISSTISVRLTLMSHVPLQLMTVPSFLFCRNTFESLNWFLSFDVSCHHLCCSPSLSRMFRFPWSRKKVWFKESLKAQPRKKEILNTFKLDRLVISDDDLEKLIIQPESQKCLNCEHVTWCFKCF